MYQTFIKEISQKSPFNHIPHIKCMVEEATGGVGKFYENLMKCPTVENFMKNPTSLNLDSMKEYFEGYQAVLKDFQTKLAEQSEIVMNYWKYQIPGFSFDMKSFNLSPKTDTQNKDIILEDVKVEPKTTKVESEPVAKKEVVSKQAAKTPAKVVSKSIVKKEATKTPVGKSIEIKAPAKTVAKKPVANEVSKTTTKAPARKAVSKVVKAK